MILTNKIALITGGSEGIGRATVDKLLSHGVVCIAVSRNIDEKIDDTLAKKRCDITKYDDVKGLAQFIEERYGALDILINNAGIWHRSAAIDEIDEHVMENVIETNLLGTMRVTKYMLPLLRHSPEAALVNIISSAGLRAQAGRCAYAASKFGLRGFTDATREDLYNTNVRVMSVYQGGTATGFFDKADDQKNVERYINPHDLAGLIVQAIAAPEKMWQNELRVDHT